MKIVVIGAGPGGIAAGKRLKDAGFDDFIILEQAEGIGGTWWHNRYPGCRCDVPSHLYSFSFALKNDWTEPFARQDEIQRYLEDCVKRFGLEDHIQLNQKVIEAKWSEATGTWRVFTADGRSFEANFLIGAVGMFNEPAYPVIEGLSVFIGPVMHSARWDAAQTLSGKRVAVIGSAASAVQLVPAIAAEVGHLDVYQRTPNYVSPRQNTFTEGERERLMRDPEAVRQERERLRDWLEAVITLDKPDLIARMQEAAMNNLAQVSDPELRQKLAPTYPFGAKRGLVSSDWYPTFNRPNVSLVTTPIQEIFPDRIMTCDGKARETDVIILATGFETTRFLSAIPIIGRAGLRLNEAWAEGAKAYLGITVNGFPNLFMTYGPNTNNGSIIAQIECQVDYIIRKIKAMNENNFEWLDVKPSALAAYNQILQEDIAKMEVWNAGVNDYYRAESGLVVTQWPHTMSRYREVTSLDDTDAYIFSQPAVDSRTQKRVNA